MKLNKNIYRLLLCAILFCTAPQVNAQIFDNDTDVDDEAAPAAPIDGFIVVSIVAGAAFGLRKKLSGQE